MIARYKALLVAKGFHQTPNIDFTETFSSIAKPVTIRVLLTLALMKGWSIRQLDVNNAFLHGYLHEYVFMEQPFRFHVSSAPPMVCHFTKALYGLKQAPRAWYDRLSSYLHSLGFRTSQANTSLLVKTTSTACCYILIYVDNVDNIIVLASSSIALD